MAFEHEVDACLRARCPLIVIGTVEEERVVRLLRDLCAGAGRSCLSWDPADGFSLVCGPELALPPARDPLSALEHLEHRDDPGVILLPDFHRCWGDAQLRRKLKAVSRKSRHSGRTLIVTTPAGEVPDDLRDVAVQLRLPLPDARELGVVLDECLAEKGMAAALGAPERARVLQTATGLALEQARTAFRRAAEAGGSMVTAVSDLVLAEVARRIGSEDALLLCAADVAADDVAGLAALKQWVLKRGAAYCAEGADYGLPRPRGVALVGIPGTGKSLAARMIAGLLGLPLLKLDMGLLFGGPAGDAEAALQRALVLTRLAAPCVLWLDEIEAAVANGILDGGSGARVFAMVRRWVRDEQAPAFVVATANDMAWLPPDLLHRDWLDEVFLLELPDARERAQILAIHLRRHGRDPARYNLNGLAAQMEGFVGAEVVRAVRDALYAAYADGKREVNDDDIARSAAEQVPVSDVLEETIESLREWRDAGRMRPASLPSAGEAGQAETPLRVDFRHRRGE